MKTKRNSITIGQALFLMTNAITHAQFTQMPNSGASEVLSSAAGRMSDYLNVTDPATIERAIEAHLTRSGIKVVAVSANGGSLQFVQISFLSPNGVPNIIHRVSALPIFLDTRADSNEVLGLALAAANQRGNCSWFVEAGEVRCRSWLGIPGPAYPIPAELIRQKIRLINTDWIKFSPQIVAAAK